MRLVPRSRDVASPKPGGAGDVLLGHAKVQHSAMDHGIMEASNCPAGFEGRTDELTAGRTG